MPTAVPDPARNHSSRREFLAGILSLAALATACNSNAPTSSRPPNEQTGEAGFPVRIQHKYGVTGITRPPDRVVTVGLTGQDYVLALGVAPVGAREWFGDHPGALWPWARKALREEPPPEVLPRNELNFEQIAALRPDLILGLNSGLTRQEYDTLAGIAPTVAQPDKYADYGIPWQEMARLTGRALGRSRRAEQYVSELGKRFDKVRAEHPRFARSTGLLATSIEGSAYVYAEGPAPRFLTSLGFVLPPSAAELFSGKKGRAPVQISLERLEVLEADVLLLGVYGQIETSVASEPLYQALDVAKEGRAIVLPEMSRLNGALSFSSVLSLPIVLDNLVPRLEAAIDGDPATKIRPVS